MFLCEKIVDTICEKRLHITFLCKIGEKYHTHTLNDTTDYGDAMLCQVQVSFD
jgi:hypothetical protein